MELKGISQNLVFFTQHSQVYPVEVAEVNLVLTRPQVMRSPLNLQEMLAQPVLLVRLVLLGLLRLYGLPGAGHPVVALAQLQPHFRVAAGDLPAYLPIIYSAQC